jgi:hypothetical protein
MIGEADFALSTPFEQGAQPLMRYAFQRRSAP